MCSFVVVIPIVHSLVNRVARRPLRPDPVSGSVLEQNHLGTHLHNRMAECQALLAGPVGRATASLPPGVVFQPSTHFLRIKWYQ